MKQCYTGGRLVGDLDRMCKRLCKQCHCPAVPLHAVAELVLWMPFSSRVAGTEAGACTRTVWTSRQSVQYFSAQHIDQRAKVSKGHVKRSYYENLSLPLVVDVDRAILRSRVDLLRSHAILHERLAFYSAFLNIHRCGVSTHSITPYC